MENGGSLVIQDKNPNKFRELSLRYPGKILIEIAQAGNGDNLNYIVVGSPKYEERLWLRDNKLNDENKSYLGMTTPRRL